MGKRIILGVAIAWIPLVILTATYGTKYLHGFLMDYRVYARAFVAIPLLLIAQVGMERRFREMSRYFLDANLVRAQDLGQFQSIMHKARRLRDAKLPEIIIVALVYLQVAYFLGSGKLSTASWAVDTARNSFTPAAFIPSWSLRSYLWVCWLWSYGRGLSG